MKKRKYKHTYSSRGRGYGDEEMWHMDHSLGDGQYDGYYHGRGINQKSKKTVQRRGSGKWILTLIKLVIIIVLIVCIFKICKPLITDVLDVSKPVISEVLNIGELIDSNLYTEKEKTDKDFSEYAASKQYNIGGKRDLNEKENMAGKILSVRFKKEDTVVQFDTYETEVLAYTDFSEIFKEQTNSVDTIKAVVEFDEKGKHKYSCLIGKTILFIYGPESNADEIREFAKGFGY